MAQTPMGLVKLGLAGLACAGSLLLQVACAAVSAPSGPLVLAREGSFFVGGHDIHSNSLSSAPPAAFSGTVTADQMYVHYQIPQAANGLSLVLIHGCCLSGATWETTPDGRMGWAQYFVRKGFATYVVDQVARGRSAAPVSAINAVKLGKAPISDLPRVFAASHESAWTVFRFGPVYPKLYPGMRFPIQAVGEFWKQMVPDWIHALPTPNPTVADLSLLAARLKRTVLVSHSESGIYPFQAVAQSGDGIAAIIAIEPGKCPDAAGDMAPYVKIPTLIVWGDYVELSPLWAPRLAQCRAFAAAVDKVGGQTKLIELPKLGIRGNTHMMMQDTNNLQIADILIAWLHKHAL